MINEKEIKKEKDYLKAVLYLLEKEIAKQGNKIDEYQTLIKEDIKYTWDYDNLSDEDEWADNMRNIELRSITKAGATEKYRTYNKMLKSAYFARIDFETEGEDIPVYLGIASLEDGTDFYVYDWRSPIAGMFYDFELGEAYYYAPSGEKIEGKITLKRQYKIVGSEIVQIFDTDMQVIDDILKAMLASKTSDKMRNIVSTIQREQNKVIRKNDCDILVVDGPAGSGKTSVAMHKIAYLLYAKRDSITKNNILIISPNEIFNNYISNVLPEIGEDNVYQTTFMDFVRGQIDFKIKGSFSEMYETYYSHDPKRKTRSLEYNSLMLKMGATYIHLIEDFIALKKNEILSISDVKVDGETVIDKARLEKFASELESSGISLYTQGKKLVEKILLHASVKLGPKSSNLAKLRKNLESNLEKVKVKALFLDLYSDEKRFVNLVENIYNTTGTSQDTRLNIKQLHDIFVWTGAQLSKNIIPFEDISGYLYLKDRISGSANQNKIKYVLIDEAQDYTVMQYKILSHLFKHASITILGDLNQCIMPFESHKNYESIINVLKQDRKSSKSDMNYLTKTYRSTYEINMFSKHILGDTNMYNQVDRHGDEVSIIKDLEDENRTKILTDALELKKYYNTVAIITKTANEASHLKTLLEGNKKSSNFRLITGKDKNFTSEKIMILPAYLAKGLEFDAVLLYNANSVNYPKEHKNLLYVAATRALHKLNVYYKGKLTELIK